MLMCDSTDKYTDYIARLVLLLFEKNPAVMSEKDQKLIDSNKADQGYIKNTIEQFLQHYVRLSKQRSTDVYCSTVLVTTYLLGFRNPQSLQSISLSEPGFQQINIFYMLGSMAEMLSLPYLDSQGIYNMGEES
jgi:hypothetical protein